jgi:hypothetical protein
MRSKLHLWLEAEVGKGLVLRVELRAHALSFDLHRPCRRTCSKLHLWSAGKGTRGRGCWVMYWLEAEGAGKGLVRGLQTHVL